MDPADGRAPFDETKHVNWQSPFVGKVGVRVVALPLCNRGPPVLGMAADAQRDPNGHGGSAQVAKVALREKLRASFSSRGTMPFQRLVGMQTQKAHRRG